MGGSSALYLIAYCIFYFWTKVLYMALLLVMSFLHPCLNDLIYKLTICRLSKKRFL